MQTRSYMYRGDADRQVLVDFVAEVTNRASANFWHIGDVLWGLYQHIDFDPQQNIRLWNDERGAMLGFAWFYPRLHSVSVYTRPELRGGDALLDAMLAWADARGRENNLTAPQPVSTQALDSDTETVDYLVRRGYIRDDDHPFYVHMRRELDAPMPRPALPAGWSVRHVGGEEEWEARVNAHRAVWHPSRVTLAAYRRLHTVPGYTPETDLVVVAPDGDFAAYCICWLDPTNAIGEFEPVGTRAEYRRRGLGKALLLEGLRRLRERNMRTAVVYTNSDNPAAIALYESVGFRIVDRDRPYIKQVGE